MPALPSGLPIWLLAVGLGGFVGSWLGARHLPPAAMRLLLAILLLVAGIRMLATGASHYF